MNSLSGRCVVVFSVVVLVVFLVECIIAGAAVVEAARAACVVCGAAVVVENSTPAFLHVHAHSLCLAWLVAHLCVFPLGEGGGGKEGR